MFQVEGITCILNTFMVHFVRKIFNGATWDFWLQVSEVAAGNKKGYALQ